MNNALYIDAQPEWLTLSLQDSVGSQHRNVWWDARHDASCTWQDVKDKKSQHEPVIYC